MRQFNYNSASFGADLESLLNRETDTGADVQQVVADIIARVRSEGDAALCDYTTRFDGWGCTSEKLEIPRHRLELGWQALSVQDRETLELAASRIRTYHEKQIQHDWSFDDGHGTTLGQRITPLDSVGLYVPGGKAAYPSSVLMNAIPAKVAGVEHLVMVVPTPQGELNDLVLGAAFISGVDRVFAIGGAQAVAALAYGTQSVPAVDKIVGPGNKYVAAAKRQVFGQCGIDMIAGPSEIAIFSDEGNPAWIAADLLSQAEHDEAAQSIFISTSAPLLEAVREQIALHLTKLPRAAIATAALHDHGALILVNDLVEAADVINRIAPEHLELAMHHPDTLLPYIKHAGAIFMGHYASEPLGDYIAGPNHVLPTNRTARFSSPLGVYDFTKRSSIIRASRKGLRHLGEAAAHLAHREGLQAHALGIELRLSEESK